MTRMPDLSRRAVLRLGAGAAAGALGAYALDRLPPARPPATTPATIGGTGGPLAPRPALEPAPPPARRPPGHEGGPGRAAGAPPAARTVPCAGRGPNDGDRLIRVCGAWRNRHQLGDRSAAGSNQTAATGDCTARQRR